MKFRGRMTEATAIRKFYSVLGSMARISKVCGLEMYFQGVHGTFYL